MVIADKLVHPFQEFMRQKSSGGLVLLVCTLIALIWANSPWAHLYHQLWQTKLTIGFGNLILAKPLALWIDDGLMAVFFFLVGLEIKREILTGELSTIKQATLPFIAALGGMVVPAIIYTLFNHNQLTVAGWGIPMATDIAFALGVLALLGNRIPLALKVFLTALAIVDDLGAVLVIALFYTNEINWINLFYGIIIIGFLISANRLGFRHAKIYAILGILLWFVFLKSGIHATIAGVVLAFTIPSKSRINCKEFVETSNGLITQFENANNNATAILNEQQQAAIEGLQHSCYEAEAPLQRLENSLLPWVSFFIMPLFALANAGVSFHGDLSSLFTSPVSLGIASGLIFGKQIGISLFIWLGIKLKITTLPTGTTWRQIYGVSWLAGIGFTMSIFISSLVFGHSPETLAIAKLGILSASFIAGIVGWIILKTAPNVINKNN